MSHLRKVAIEMKWRCVEFLDQYARERGVEETRLQTKHADGDSLFLAEAKKNLYYNQAHRGRGLTFGLPCVQ